MAYMFVERSRRLGKAMALLMMEADRDPSVYEFQMLPVDDDLAPDEYRCSYPPRLGDQTKGKKQARNDRRWVGRNQYNTKASRR